MTTRFDLDVSFATALSICPASSCATRVVVTADGMSFVNSADDECLDLDDAIASLSSPEPSISLEEFRRRHGLR